MNKINYQKELDKIIEKNLADNKTPSLLLHVCCAPCSSYCLEYLSRYFNITVYYYNPNISEKEEYEYRLSEEFFKAVKGFENEPEGGKRCENCFRLRLEASAKFAKEKKFDFFTTTLTISPLKNADKLNSIGVQLAEKHGVKWLYSDFKKREGYKRSIILSKEYSLYRQNYCGCVFSKRAVSANNI